MATIRICAQNGCGNPHFAKGYCKFHYRRFTDGVPMELPTRATREQMLQFATAALHSATDECILWPFGKNSSGYAAMRPLPPFFGTSAVLSRLMCQAAHGAQPTDAHEAAHFCGVRHCINPRHLRWATTVENDADKDRHGTRQPGPKERFAKITQEDADDIRALAKSGLTPKQCAERYPITVGHVRDIIRGLAWA